MTTAVSPSHRVAGTRERVWERTGGGPSARPPRKRSCTSDPYQGMLNEPGAELALQAVALTTLWYSVPVLPGVSRR